MRRWDINKRNLIICMLLTCGIIISFLSGCSSNKKCYICGKVAKPEDLTENAHYDCLKSITKSCSYEGCNATGIVDKTIKNITYGDYSFGAYSCDKHTEQTKKLLELRYKKYGHLLRVGEWGPTWKFDTALEINILANEAIRRKDNDFCSVSLTEPCRTDEYGRKWVTIRGFSTAHGRKEYANVTVCITSNGLVYDMKFDWDK